MDPLVELAIRTSFFAVVFAAMALWEIGAPRRALVAGRNLRWPNNLGILLIGVICVRVLIPTAAVGANPIEVYYSGGVCLDHQDPDVAYVSIGSGSNRWDIFRAVTTDSGATWTFTRLTNSGKQVRPISVIGADRGG